MVNHHEDQATIVRVRGLRKSYGRTQAVRDVDLEVRRGEIFGLIGPDGAGKSSVIKCTAGVLTFDVGEIRLFDRSIGSERAAERMKGRLGLMPQGLGNNLYPELSVAENVDYFARLRLLPRDEAARRKEELLRMTRLNRFVDRPMKQLSGGMKQKLGLVCTLIHFPEIILLDEPTTGVDPVSRRDFWSILTELIHQQSMTAIVSTAYLDEAAYFNRLALFMEGKIVSQGSERDIANLVKGTKLSLRPGDQVAALNRLKREIPQVETMGRDLHVFVQGAGEREAVEQITAALGQPVDREHVTPLRKDLEDVLVALLLKQRRGAFADRDDSAASEEVAAGESEVTPQGKKAVADENRARRGEENGIAIRAEKLVRRFGDFRAVDQVSLEVSRGAIFGLLGANGAGKTTVIKMLTGLLPPSSGLASVAGVDMSTSPQRVKRQIGYMSQIFSLYLDLTVRENIELYAGVYGLSRRASRRRRDWVLQMSGLGDRRDAATKSLPMGLRQRLALGCALVHQPEVVFLDEPTSGVDPLGRRHFWETLVRLAREEQVTMLVTTHYMSEAEHCDQLALMYEGRMIVDGSPEQLRDNLAQSVGTPLVVEVERPVESLRVVRQAGFPTASLLGNRIRVLSSDHAGDCETILKAFERAGLGTLETQERPLNMQDVFVHHMMSQETKPGSR